ncbi:MAG: ACT domain-containing protein [Chitinispirillia bacterium]|nr:ACT domain-containing protein [Chitinispirillia bacterium]MCL2268447.1 ACT domain-containing protein [Chitinispirillia bacterium]
MRAIVSVVGKDRMGIIARVSGFLFSIDINVLDISQSILQEYFHMIMLVDVSKCSKRFSEISDELDKLGSEIGMSITIQHEDIFNAMHKI